MSVEANLKLIAEKFYGACFTDLRLTKGEFAKRINELMKQLDDDGEKIVVLNEVIRLGKLLIESGAYIEEETTYSKFTTYPSDN